jgi:autotransporter-associated beta strand protein
MLCNEAREHLSAYLDKELSADLSAAVRAHVDSCAECRALAADLQATANLLGRLPVRKAPATTAADVQREIERRLILEAPETVEGELPERTLPIRRARQWPRVVAMAATVALASGIGILAYLNNQAPTTLVAHNERAQTAPESALVSAYDGKKADATHLDAVPTESPAPPAASTPPAPPAAATPPIALTFEAAPAPPASAGAEFAAAPPAPLLTSDQPPAPAAATEAGPSPAAEPLFVATAKQSATDRLDDKAREARRGGETAGKFAAADLNRANRESKDSVPPVFSLNDSTTLASADDLSGNTAIFGNGTLVKSAPATLPHGDRIMHDDAIHMAGADGSRALGVDAGTLNGTLILGAGNAITVTGGTWRVVNDGLADDNYNYFLGSGSGQIAVINNQSKLAADGHATLYLDGVDNFAGQTNAPDSFRFYQPGMLVVNGQLSGAALNGAGDKLSLSGYRTFDNDRDGDADVAGAHFKNTRESGQAANLEGAGGVTKASGGTLAMGGTNTYAAGTTLNSGAAYDLNGTCETVARDTKPTNKSEISSPSRDGAPKVSLKPACDTLAMGETTAVNNGGTLDINGYHQNVTSLSGSGSALGTGSVATQVQVATTSAPKQQSDMRLGLAGAKNEEAKTVGKSGATFSKSEGADTGEANNWADRETGTVGNFNLSGGTLAFGDTKALSSMTTFNGTISGGGVLTKSGAGALVLSNAGGLAKTGTGEVTVTQANTYTGSANVSAGTLHAAGGSFKAEGSRSDAEESLKGAGSAPASAPGMGAARKMPAPVAAATPAPAAKLAAPAAPAFSEALVETKESEGARRFKENDARKEDLPVLAEKLAQAVESLEKSKAGHELGRAADYQLVLHADSAAEATTALAGLFQANGWQASSADEADNAKRLPTPTDSSSAKKTKSEEVPAKLAGAYQVVSHGPDGTTLVIVTTRDSLSRFASQLTQSQGMTVDGPASSEAFKAVANVQAILRSRTQLAYAGDIGGGSATVGSATGGSGGGGGRGGPTNRPEPSAGGYARSSTAELPAAAPTDAGLNLFATKAAPTSAPKAAPPAPATPVLDKSGGDSRGASVVDPNAPEIMGGLAERAPTRAAAASTATKLDDAWKTVDRVEAENQTSMDLQRAPSQPIAQKAAPSGGDQIVLVIRVLTASADAKAAQIAKPATTLEASPPATLVP